MLSWLRDRSIFLVAVAFLLVFLSLTLLAGLGDWGVRGLIPLSVAALASAGAFTLALLRLARVPPRNWGRELRQRDRSFADAQERILDLTTELRRKSDQLTTERDCSEFLRQSFAELASSLDPRQVLNNILSRAISATHAQHGSIMLFDAQGHPEQAFMSRLSKPDAGWRPEILDKGLSGWVLHNRRSAVIFDTQQDERWYTFPGDEESSRSAVGVPFMRRDRVLGVMVLTHPIPFQFTETHQQLLEELAQQAAICLETADLYTEAETERRKLAAILEGTTDAVIVIDTGGQVLMINSAAGRAFVSANEALGRSLSFGIQHPALQALFEQAQAGGEAVTGELTTADERVRYASVSPIPDVGWVVILQDITYLKELDRLKSEFVSTVSHDLRSPLTSVRGYADLVRLVGAVSAEQQGFLDRIQHAVAHMTELINDLLDLAKIEAGIDMSKDSCSLADIAREVVESLQSNAATKGLDLQAEIGAGLPPVQGNANRLRQVVANLADNAIKYTPQGGQVHLRLARHEGEIVLSVTDTGIGIAPQDQQQLFQKFYRVKTPETDGIPGTGLGLALVRSIVEQHGGRIWLHSVHGQGSTFSVALPVEGIPVQNLTL